jgi:two-component system, chemotaxis family, chemotaxis protein CheY
MKFGGNMKVFVVDDSATVRDMVKEMLSRMGHTYDEAGDGDEAIKKLESGCAFDCTLLDWNMPKINGIQVLEAVKKKKLKAGGVIMMTTETDPRSIAVALQNGAVEYLMKPFTEDILHSKLQLANSGE